jgi:hypothetical protein
LLERTTYCRRLKETRSSEMRNQNVVAGIPQQDRQLRMELLGDWYNYEPKDAELDAEKVDHWLTRLEESLKLPAAASGLDGLDSV